MEAENLGSDLEGRLFESAVERFRQGETYASTPHEAQRDALMKQYGEWAVERYRRTPEYRKPEVLETYGIEVR